MLTGHSCRFLRLVVSTLINVNRGHRSEQSPRVGYWDTKSYLYEVRGVLCRLRTVVHEKVGDLVTHFTIGWFDPGTQVLRTRLINRVIMNRSIDSFLFRSTSTKDRVYTPSHFMSC